jgi:N,N'-diacetyllegionaminate synthase
MSKKVYVIAEIGPNHNGNVDIALALIDKISEAGADAVKFQMANPYLLYSDDSFKASYQRKNDSSKGAREMSLRYQLLKEEHYNIYCHCREIGIDYICTAFDMESLLYLETKFEMSYYKIASGEIFSLDIIDYISTRDKPIILSTGMATYDEIEKSINLLNKNFKKDITVLHCISNYPAQYEEVNLLNMIELKKRFGYKVGFSDHTLGNECAIAAIAMGAEVIEKHVTFDKNAEGPDHKASIDMMELKSLVDSIRHIESAIGVSERVFSEAQREISKVARKSCVTLRNIRKGEVLKHSDICFKRPGTGYLPIEIDEIIGKRLLCDIDADRVIKADFLE